MATARRKVAKSTTRRAAPSLTHNRAGAPIPLLEYDGRRAAIIEPARVIKPIDVAEHCVMCFFQEVIRELVSEGASTRLIHTGRSEAGDYPVYEMDYGGRRLAVVSPGVGGPAAAARMELMIALGCRKFIACGGAGTLDGAIAAGHIVVPDSAVRDEGASFHYLKPSREVAPTPRALAAIEAVLRENHHEYLRGKTWTTDAVYRETRARMNLRRRAFAACSARRSFTAATAWPAAAGIRAHGTATRCASGCSIWRPRPVCACSPATSRSDRRPPRSPCRSQKRNRPSTATARRWRSHRACPGGRPARSPTSARRAAG